MQLERWGVGGRIGRVSALGGVACDGGEGGMVGGVEKWGQCMVNRFSDSTVIKF